MRIEFSQVSVRDLYHRNPTDVSTFFSGYLVPNPVTVRATYTVPAGKIAILNHGNILAVRYVAGAPVGEAQFGLARTYGGVTQDLLLVIFSDNTLYGTHRDELALNLLLLEGARIDMFSSDISVGGQIFCNLSAGITEFDNT